MDDKRRWIFGDFRDPRDGRVSESCHDVFAASHDVQASAHMGARIGRTLPRRCIDESADDQAVYLTSALDFRSCMLCLLRATEDVLSICHRSVPSGLPRPVTCSLPYIVAVDKRHGHWIWRASEAQQAESLTELRLISLVQGALRSVSSMTPSLLTVGTEPSGVADSHRHHSTVIGRCL